MTYSEVVVKAVGKIKPKDFWKFPIQPPPSPIFLIIFMFSVHFLGKVIENE